MAATSTKKSDNIKLVDQMLEDIAGEEFDDFAEQDGYAARLPRFVDDEAFTEIDNYH